MQPNSTKAILAIDLGTSGPKVALVTTAGEILGSEFEETPLILLPGGGAEQEPDAWWGAIVTAARRLLARELIPRSAIAGVCCTSQWSGTVPLGRDGRPLMNAIIWMDSRGAKHMPDVLGGRLKIEGYGPKRLLRWLRLTGGAPGKSGKDPFAHVLFIRRERPEIYAQTDKFLEVKDYLNYRLTGLMAASFDSITLHWVTDNRDLSRVAYDPTLLRWAGVERERLPELKRASDVLGPVTPAVAAELGIPEGAPVVMGTPDVMSAAIGSGAVEDYAGHLYVGTSSWITCHVPFKKTALADNIASLPSALPGRYLIAGEQECAGKCLMFLRDNLLFPDDALNPGGARPEGVYARFDALAEAAAPGAGGVIFLPWLYGERTPIEDHHVRGGFFHMSLGTTRAQLVRSVLEGVALNSRWYLEAIERFIGRRVDGLNFIGGGARSRIWCQIFADVLDREIRQIAEPIDANARGAGLLGAAGLGLIKLEDIAALVTVQERFAPNPANRALYDALAQEFVGLYKRNRKAHGRLARLFER